MSEYGSYKWSGNAYAPGTSSSMTTLSSGGGQSTPPPSVRIDPPQRRHSCDLPKLGWWNRHRLGLTEGSRATCPCGNTYKLTLGTWYSGIRPHWHWAWTVDTDNPPRIRT